MFYDFVVFWPKTRLCYDFRGFWGLLWDPLGGIFWLVFGRNSFDVSMNYWRSGPDSVLVGTIGVPWDDCQNCSSDINGDGMTNIDDLLGILAFWGHVGDHPSDVNGDQLVNVDDLLVIIGGWGPCG